MAVLSHDDSELKPLQSERIAFVGNVMIDTLLANMPQINKSKALKAYGLKPKAYSVLTLHRPSNVDQEGALSEIYDILKSVTEKIKVNITVNTNTAKIW